MEKQAGIDGVTASRGADDDISEVALPPPPPPPPPPPEVNNSVITNTMQIRSAWFSVSILLLSMYYIPEPSQMTIQYGVRKACGM